jgi:hypothetical protein
MEQLLILIAPGHDNQDNLKILHELQPPLFHLYSEGFLHEFYDCDQRVRGGDRKWKKQGLPSAKIVVPLINNFEIAYLREEINDGEDSGDVTVEMLNTSLMVRQVFNATFDLPELRSLYQNGWEYCEWRDYEINFTDMVVLDDVRPLIG